MSDRILLLGAGLAVLVAATAPAVPPAASLLFVGLAVVTRRPEPVLLAVVVLVGGRANAAVLGLDRPLGDRVAGVAQLAADPEPGRFGTSVVLRLHGRRYLAAFDRDAEWVLRSSLTGDHVVVQGRVRPFGEVPEGWRRSRHLAGRISVDAAGPGPPAAPWYRLANGLHRILARGAESFDPGDRSLYLGLVIGDDRAQDDLDRFRFRASGLGHLLAVSGQNVAFVMVVAGPLLERLPMRPRLAVALAVLVVFVLVTRAEPSVLRAAVMTGVVLVATTAGRLAPAPRVLGLAVMVLLVADPMLVHSIGFRLSVSATAGLLVLHRPLLDRLPGPPWLASPLAATLAAQAGTAPFLLPFTGGLPAVSVVANLLAVPAAGAVMTLGLSVGLVAGLVRSGPAAVLQLPSRTLVAWVDGVATVASRVPTAPLGPARLLAAVGAVVGAWWLGRRLTLRRTRAGRLGAAGVHLVAATAVIGAVLPVPLPPGTHALDGGSTLVVGACGRSVVLGPSAGTLDVLDGLWHLGITSAAAVTGSARDPTVAVQVAEQLGARAGPAGAGPCPDGGVASRP